jgi:outer membrane protein insertion porin family
VLVTPRAPRRPGPTPLAFAALLFALWGLFWPTRALADGPLSVATIQLGGDVLGRLAVLEAAGIEEGARLAEADVPALATRLEAFYARRGYPRARVAVSLGETDEPGRVVLSFEVFHEVGAERLAGPGPARLVEQRVFVVDPVIDQELGERRSLYRFGRGARADEPLLADADRELTEALRKDLFLRAQVSHTVEERGEVTTLFVHVDAGPRFELGFEGNRAFDADQLRSILASDDPRDSEPEELVTRLRRHYVVHGFLDATVRVREEGAEREAVHHLVLTVNEGPTVRVERRIFACLPAGNGLTGLSAGDLGTELQAVLEEELPGADLTAAVDAAEVSELFGPREGRGGRAAPEAVLPAAIYAPETYQRGVEHLRDLVQSKGYLHAVVGPLVVLRARCSPASPPGSCVPERAVVAPAARCDVDAFGLPLPPLPPSAEQTCRPDPLRRVTCAPEVTLWIPVHLGPQTTLYDLAFQGNVHLGSSELARETELELGKPLSNVTLDAARAAILEAYRREGFAFVEARTTVEPSPDRTRARARFTLIEGPRVEVTGFDVRGLVRTDMDLVLRRLAFTVGQPYRSTEVRASEERIAALGVFSSVAIGLERPELPEAKKRVVITVSEQLPQYVEPRIGFSTGDGLRFGFDYGHRNIAGVALGLQLGMQLSYLFDFMIIDPAVRQSYAAGDCRRAESGELVCGPLQVIDRLEGRGTVSVTVPVASLFTASLDGLFVRDNQRDFGLTKRSLGPSLAYRPTQKLSLSVGVSGELNDVQLFNADTVENAIRNNPALSTLLRVPDGATYVLAERALGTWDRRDNPFAAKSGLLVSAGAEHVDAFPSEGGTFESHFVRLTNRVAGYVRLTKKGTSLALSLSSGYNLQLAPSDPNSRTYPDRLFFLGGVDSIRAFLADSVVPEDIAQCLLDPKARTGCTALQIQDVAIRGGDLMLNPRAEVRIPYSELVELGLFLDTGNLWQDPAEVDLLALRYGAGAGLRFITPIGPLALDYGINLSRRPWEDFGAFHFSIGLF